MPHRAALSRGADSVYVVQVPHSWFRRLHDDGYFAAFSAAAVTGQLIGWLLPGRPGGVLSWPLSWAASVAGCWWVLRACGLGAAAPTAVWYAVFAVATRTLTRLSGTMILAAPLTALAPLVGRRIALRGETAEQATPRLGPCRALHDDGYFVAVAGAVLFGGSIGPLLAIVLGVTTASGEFLSGVLIVLTALLVVAVGAGAAGCWLTLRLCQFDRAARTAAWVVLLCTGFAFLGVDAIRLPSLSLTLFPLLARRIALVTRPDSSR